jgi:hypothetical protein
MFIALLGYIGTMVAAFVTLVVVWHHVIGPPQAETVREQPGPIGAVVQTVPAAAPASAEDARAPAAKVAAAENAKRLKQARYLKRREREQLARRRDQQQYSALGYDQEPRDIPPPFNAFGPRRF